MHRQLRFRGRVRRVRDERGLAAVMIAISLTALLVASGMVLDFGLVRVDRQVNKSAADSAAMAGLHGLFGGDNSAKPYAGVCTAVRYLQQNGARFAGVSDTSGSWTDATGAATGNGCTDAALQSQSCSPTNQSTWSKFTWNGTYQTTALKVVIQSGYTISGFAEDSLPAAQADSADDNSGCDQLAVVITENRKPGLGSIARSADLVSSVRTVGRIKSSPSGDAPAMLLLKRTGCPVLVTGANGGGSYIHVYGAVSSTGLTQPGSIHSDSDGVSCSTLFQGRANDGIVAYAAPLASNPTSADPTKPGQITSYAGYRGMSSVTDSGSSVYASGAVNEAGANAAAKTAPTGRGLVTRSLVDQRYLTGVRNAISDAQSGVFGSLTASNAGSNGYTVLADCNPSGTINASRLFVDCTDNNGYKGTATINATTVVFNGKINPSTAVSLPNADHVYVFGSSSDAMVLGATFSMHTAGNVDASGNCSTTTTSSKAVLFIRNGDIKESNGGLLRLCNTTVLMMGGQGDGCLPSTLGTAPTQSPCGSTMGTGQLSQTGGNVDWTAPNQYDQMTDSNGDPLPFATAAWNDVNGPEDLAFWSESAGNNSSTTYNMNGGGMLRTRGVYMVPNADSFSIGGNAHQDLTNAQYIATSIALNGNTTQITMRVDANSAVTLPRKRLVGLVR